MCHLNLQCCENATPTKLSARKFTRHIEFASPDGQNCNNLEEGLERAAQCGCPRVKYEEEKYSMNKKLMALAVAGALTAPAAALAQVQIYGRANVGIDTYSATGATAGSAADFKNRNVVYDSG